MGRTDEELDDELDPDLDDDLADDDADDLDLDDADDLGADDLSEVEIPLDDDDFDDDEEEEVIRRPVPKRRARAKVVPMVEGVPIARLTDSEVAADVWKKLHAKGSKKEAVTYNIRARLGRDDVIEHPRFGIGYVVEVTGPQKVSVVFEDGMRKLVCNRP